MATLTPKRQEKTISYYGITIKNIENGASEANNIRSIFQEIFERKCTKTSPKTLTLSTGEQQVTMDILEDNDVYLFARVGKIKPNAEMQVRDLNTGMRENVIPKSELKDKGVEICTYFLLDYTNGIVGFVFGQSAPTAYILANIVNQHNALYNMSISPIVSMDSVKALLNPRSQISKINYTFLLPDPALLRNLGLKDEIIYNLDEEDMEVQLTIKPSKRNPITKVTEKIQVIIDNLSKVSKDQQYKNIYVTGKSGSSITKNYKFANDLLSFKVDLKLQKNADGFLISLTPEELAREVNKSMRVVYLENRDYLETLSNRNE